MSLHTIDVEPTTLQRKFVPRNPTLFSFELDLQFSVNDLRFHAIDVQPHTLKLKSLLRDPTLFSFELDFKFSATDLIFHAIDVEPHTLKVNFVSLLQLVYFYFKFSVRDVNFSFNCIPNCDRYEYEEISAEWTTNGQLPGQENNISKCSNLDASQINALIGVTQYPSPADIIYKEPYTFRVARPAFNSNATNGTEVLEIQGIKMDSTIQGHWRAYLYHPYAVADTPVGCPEFIGIFNIVPHVGQANYHRNRAWRVALGPKLQALGMENYTDVVITLAQYGPTIQPMTFAKVSIVYDMSPQS